jgi:2-polyprenyl-3-methyl-5-hydroxy-6-metoxy-1,4-benzoquinol methylase
VRFLQTLEFARLCHPSRVLDLAAGDDALGACLVLYSAAATVDDLREDELRSALARFQCRDRIGVHWGSIFDLDPKKLGPFELAIACEVIEHVARSAELIHLARRFLAPHARILLTTSSGPYFRNQLPTQVGAGDPATLEARRFKPDADGRLFLTAPNELRGVAR